MQHVRKEGNMGAEIENLPIKMMVKNTLKFRPAARAEDGDPGTHGGDFRGVPSSTF